MEDLNRRRPLAGARQILTSGGATIMVKLLELHEFRALANLRLGSPMDHRFRELLRELGAAWERSETARFDALMDQISALARELAELEKL